MNKIYRYDITTKEFIQEIEVNRAYGTNLPYTTTVIPSKQKVGFAVCFDESKEEWEYQEDNRGKTVYCTATKQELKVDYLGVIKIEHTTIKPNEFDVWNETIKAWKEDAIAKSEYEKEQAKIQKEIELNTLTITNNTVLYDAHQEAIGNMSAVIGIANATYIRLISVGTQENGNVPMSAADAYNNVYKQTVNWKGADDKWHTVQLESLVETTQKAMTEKATVLSKY